MLKKIERILPKPAQLSKIGDDLPVYTYLPHPEVSKERMNPFLLLYYHPFICFDPADVPKGVNAHPHRGTDTVVYPLRGTVYHYDSFGNKGSIQPGDVQWITTGDGLFHQECLEEEFAKSGGIVELVHFWINLPRKYKYRSPSYQLIAAADIKVLQLPEGFVKVIAGECNGVGGNVETRSPINLFHISLDAGGHFITNIPMFHHTGILVIKGDMLINGLAAEEYSFVLFDLIGEEIRIEALTNASCLLFSGEPIDEPIVSYGPFVMNTEDELQQAVNEYMDGKYGKLS
jgi:redox-sensitive bicupin YhaK (pirin superfamily)